jgi:predicted kinase
MAKLDEKQQKSKIEQLKSINEALKKLVEEGDEKVINLKKQQAEDQSRIEQLAQQNGILEKQLEEMNKNKKKGDENMRENEKAEVFFFE